MDKPFSLLSNEELLSFFVGRESELRRISQHVANGHRVLAITGPPGTGKTRLARVFAERHQQKFSGGIFYLDDTWLANPTTLLERDNLQQLPARSLIVIDEAQALGPAGLRELRRRIFDSPLTFGIAISHFKTELLPFTDYIIDLSGLTMEEFDELFRLQNGIAYGRFDERIKVALFDLSHGNPMLALAAIKAVRDGIVRSWDELINYLRVFHSPGILGPDGRPFEHYNPKHTAIILDVSAANEELLRMLRRDSRLVWKLPPRRFEEIVADLLERQGYEVSLTPASGDGGFDIYAAKKDGLGQFLFLVECKRYVPPNKVGVEIVRALYGVVQAQRATAGAIVTSSYFTSGAEKYRRSVKHQLQLHDYIALQKWLRDLRFMT